MGAFGLDLIWAKNCHQALLLLAHYGNGGSRYEDPRVIDRVEDATVRPGSMARLLRLLKSVDHIYSEERQEQRVIEEDPEEYPLDLEESPAAADQATAAPVVLVPKVAVVSPPHQQIHKNLPEHHRFCNIPTIVHSFSQHPRSLQKVPILQRSSPEHHRVPECSSSTETTSVESRLVITQHNI